MNKAVLHSMTSAERKLVMDTEPSASAALDEEELLELHTVGVDAGYTQDDVVTSALIITGYRVDVYDDFYTAYDRHSHAKGAVTLVADPVNHPDLAFTRTLPRCMM